MLKYLKKISESAFSLLLPDESLALNLHSEESDFIRFNHSKIRQNTTVQQHEISLQYQLNLRSYTAKFNLQLDHDVDLAKIKMFIERLRIELPQTDPNPQFVPIKNNGQSTTYKNVIRPPTAEVIAIITATFSDSDLAGLWCSGPLRQASINSKGQFHFFETDYFFFDYSLYDGPRASKAFYADEEWDSNRFLESAQLAKNTLALLKKPTIAVKPGLHKAYLGPMAVAEVLGLFNWRALSRNFYEQGFAPLKKLVENEILMSEKFTLLENLSLGYSTPFNSLGEIGPQVLPIIEKGRLKNLLISTPTATEYNLTSNFAEPAESLRSPEVKPGTLQESQILQTLGTGLYLSHLHYINWSDSQAARITGMTRFACFWVEGGEIVGPIQDLRFDETLYNIFGKNLLDLTEKQQVYTDTSTYLKRSLSGLKVPGALVDQMNFTL